MIAPYFLGIDIGTQGARVALIDIQGNLIGSCGEVFPLSDHSRQEQSPLQWWDACVHSLKQLIAQVRSEIDIMAITAVSVASTSGTVIPLDAHDAPLHDAIMYSDNRSVKEAALCSEIAGRYHPHAYTAFTTSSGLSKMVWFINAFPDKAAKIRRWVHAADYITGRLSGCRDVTDHTNAFKSGYDVKNYRWPEYLYEQLPLKKDWLPTVVRSGTVIGELDRSLAHTLGLPAHVQITAGITDGCASQIASGAISPGDWNTTIGTTLVIKGVTKNEILDPLGRIYSHRHPSGYWMPGGASNTGADWVTNDFTDLGNLEAQAARMIPTGHIAYPLRQKGERFPFIAPHARGFEPEGLTPAQRFAANMEGVAYLERYAFQLIENLGGEKVGAVFTAGGGSNSDTWLTIRSNVLNLPVFKMKYVSGAVGAAILAASQTQFSSVIEAARHLTQVDKEIYPEHSMVGRYEHNYRKFTALLEEKGYIKKEDIYA